MTPPDTAELIETHLPLVRHVVYQTAHTFPFHIDRSELAAAGALGLVEAAHRYEPTRGAFSPFAAAKIRGAILDAARSWDWAPRSVRSSARQLAISGAALTGRLGRAPTAAEVAAALGVTVADVAEIEARTDRAIVLALEFSHITDDTGNILDVLAEERTVDPPVELERRELHAYLRHAIALLGDNQRVVIVGYFLEGRRSDDLATQLGITESRVSQIRSEAVICLRDGINAQYTDRAAARPVGRVAHRQDRYADAIAAAGRWQDRLDLQETR